MERSILVRSGFLLRILAPVAIVLMALATTSILASRPVSASGADAVSTRAAHACAATAGGGQKCWSDNSNKGALGDGTTTERHMPADAFGLTGGGATTCPTPPAYSFSVDDPAGDAIPRTPRHDITSVAGQGDASTFCLTVEFAGQVDPADAGTGHVVVGYIDFDNDQNWQTGKTSALHYFCQGSSRMGVEATLDLFSVANGFGSLDGNPIPVTFDHTSFTAIIPLSLVGGDAAFDVGMAVGTASGPFAGPTDCAPEGAGCIESPSGDLCPPPQNDHFANAVAFSGPLPYTNRQSTPGATTETNEPLSCGPMTTKTVWYRFTASTTQLVAADTLGSDYYTVLAVYRGADVAALTPVACNENYFGQTPFLASAGTTYYFQVGGPFGANGGLHNSAGRLVFNLRAAPPPSMGNDDFGEALEILDPLPYTNSENTAGATSETNEPSPCGAIGTTVWYRFTPSSDRTLIADTFGSNFDTALAVYTGADLSALTLQGCSDNFPDFRSSVKFKATAGTTYYVQAGGAQGIAGDLALHLVDAPSPCAPSTCPQFVLGIDVDNDGQDDCNTRDGPTTCVARQDDRFALHVYLDNLGSAQSYGGFDLVMTYAGVSSKDNADAEAWPDCAYEASAYDPGFLALACAIGVASPNSVYTGLIGTADFNCTDSGVITMLHGYGWTALVENLQSPVLHEGETISETLIIDCALDIDSDGDGCSDDAERQTATGSELSGGRRDYLNSHDYFNPTGDGQNRLDDVLAVLDQYSKDDNDQSPGLPPYAAGYNPDADRTLLGPNAWNLGPPNGLQRVDDILNIVKQYFHDCS